MADEDFIIGTDVAHFVIFHPADLVHRDRDPIAWYGYDFAYHKESAAGRLIAWGTGSDGGYRIRLTTEALTDAEKAAACKGWSFPLAVRHGRVLLDNTDALPGEEQMSDPDTLDEGWYAIANGNYRVTVHPIDRSEDNALPDYVVRFTAISDLSEVEAAPTPPELRPYKDWEPRLAGSFGGEAGYIWPTRAVDTESLPLLVVSEETTALPGMATTQSVADEVADLAFPEDRRSAPEYLATAGSAIEGQLAVIGRRSGLSRLGDAAARLTVNGMAIGRIARVTEGPVLPLVDVELLDKPDMTADAAMVERLRTLLREAAADGRIAASSFEREQMEALTSGEALTGWALHYLGLPLGQRLSIYASPAAERIKDIGKVLG